MRLLIFDIDGTLLKADDICFEIGFFSQAFSNICQRQLRVKECFEYKNYTDLGIFSESYYDIFKELPSNSHLSSFERLYSENVRESLRNGVFKILEIPGACRFISKLMVTEGFHIAIATGNLEAVAKLKLNEISLDDLKVPIASSNDSHRREEILEKAIVRSQEYYNQSYDKVIYFGDGEWDFKATKLLDIPLIGIGSNKVFQENNVVCFSNFLDTQIIMDEINRV